jgi:glycerophosphoryl diester phosphodiesterase
MALPELVAHRGYRLHYPENTLPAIEAALRAGARLVEIDVQLSRDRIPMVFHDDTLARVCGVSGAIFDHTATELKKLRASEYQRFGYRYATTRIPTLQEFAELLAREANVTGFVELKEESLARFGIEDMLARVCAVLARVRDRAVIISYSLDALLAARQAGWPKLGVVIDHWRERRKPQIKNIAPQYLFCDIKGLPMFGKFRAAAAHVVVFEVDDAANAVRLFRRGVNFIETFAIGEMRRALEAFSTS